MVRRRILAAQLGLLLLGVAGAAEAATPLSMSSRHGYFCCTNPNQFLGGAPLGVATNGYFTNTGTVSATGSGPASIVFPASAINVSNMFTLSPHPNPAVKYVKTFLSFANAPGTLAPGAGPGSFSFCPSAMGPGVGSCTAPSQAGPSPRNGRIYVKAGPNQFGGTLQMLAGPGGANGGLGGLSGYIWIYPNGAPPTYTLVNFSVPLNVIGAATTGKRVTLMNLSYTGTGGGLNGPYVTTGSVAGAGPWTTGYALVQITKNANPPTQSVAVSGYDTRTPMGVGNIQLVGGLLVNGGPATPSTAARATTLRLSLPEPGPALGLLAGAAALGLVGVSGVTRRR